jgi:periplasmic protein TonB
MAAQTTVRRPFGAMGRMGVVAGMHLALVFVIANSFGLIPKSKLPPDIIGTVFNDPQPIDPPPPTTNPVIPDNTQVYVPIPDDPSFEHESTETITATRVDPREIPIETPRAVPDPIPMTGVRLDPRHPLTQPRYPAELIRDGTQGAVEVELFVQPDGRVADARVIKTSGYPAFDRSTLQEAHTWRLLPAMRGDEKLAQWYRLRVVFNLKNQ